LHQKQNNNVCVDFYQYSKKLLRAKVDLTINGVVSNLKASKDTK